MGRLPAMPAGAHRRAFLRKLLAASLGAPLSAAARAAATGTDAGPVADMPGAALAPWTPGCLDIHHIATGRGNATFVMLPDATSLLIDAGASADGTDVSVATRPSRSRRAGEWIGRYVERHLRAAGRDRLDYLLVTHFHPDHLGDVVPGLPSSRHGDYLLTGVTDVAEIVPIGTLVDRGFPDYDNPAPMPGAFADNYRAFVRARLERGLAVERFDVGSATQLRGRGHVPAVVPAEVRNIVANGIVWTGTGTGTRALFPPAATLAPADRPNENLCSAGIRIGCGNFRYFTAGDLTSYTYDGALPWRDVLTAAARVAGPVDVATADHHGLFDGLSADAVRALAPRAWVIPTWHISQPDLLQLERMFSERLYPGPRDVFATTLMAENMLANRRMTSRLASTDGHVVVRVAPGGASYRIAVTDNADEADRVGRVTASLAAR